MRTMLFGCAAVLAATAAAPPPAQAQFAGPLVAVPEIASNRSSVTWRNWVAQNRLRQSDPRYGWVDMVVGNLGDGEWALRNRRSEYQSSNDWLQQGPERRFPR